MGRACRCCGAECKIENFYFFVDRYKENHVSVFTKTEELYEIIYEESLGVESGNPKKISTETINDTDDSFFVVNTYRTEVESSERFNDRGRIFRREIHKKTTIIRRMAIEYSIDDVFDWGDSSPIDGESFIKEISLRLGYYFSDTFDDSNEWKSKTRYAKISGILENKPLPSSLSMFNSYVSSSSLITEIQNPQALNTIDIKDIITKRNAKFLFLIEPLDVETKDEFLDEEEESETGSSIEIGNWGRYVRESMTWLELYRKRKEALNNLYLAWISDWPSNITQDWHTCFDRTANAEYVSSCLYMDVQILTDDFLDFDYFEGKTISSSEEQSGKLEVEIFKPKTDNTKQGAAKTYFKDLFELSYDRDYVDSFVSGYSCDTEDGSYNLADLPFGLDEEDLIDPPPATIDPTSCSSDFNPVIKYNDGEVWRWKYSDYIMREVVKNSTGINSFFSGFSGVDFPIDEWGSLDNFFIRDCMIESPKAFIDGDYKKYYSRPPHRDEVLPSSFRFKLIDFPYYPEVLTIRDIRNPRTLNNKECPLDECIAGPTYAEWDLLSESYPDLGDSTDHSLVYHGGAPLRPFLTAGISAAGACTTSIISVYEPPEAGGSYQIAYTVGKNEARYEPSTSIVYFLGGESPYGIGWTPPFNPILNPDGVFPLYNNSGYSGINDDDPILVDIGSQCGGMGGGAGPGLSPILINGGFTGGMITYSGDCQLGCNYLSFILRLKADVVGYGGGDIFNVHTAAGNSGAASNQNNPCQVIQVSYDAGYSGYAVFDSVATDNWTLASVENIENWEVGNPTYASRYEISTINEPYRRNFNEFNASKKTGVTDVVLGGSPVLFEHADSFEEYVFEVGSYSAGDGIRFRINDSFFDGSDTVSSYGDFDILYQQWVPIISRNEQLSQDDIDEIAGYITDFKYWYGLKGDVFVEEENGQEIRIINDQIVVGTVYKNPYFFIDGAGNVSAPQNQLGFVPTAPDLAVYVFVMLDYYGFEAQQGYYPDDEIDSRISLGFSNTDGTSVKIPEVMGEYESEWPEEIITDYDWPRQTIVLSERFVQPTEFSSRTCSGLGNVGLSRFVIIEGGLGSPGVGLGKDPGNRVEETYTHIFLGPSFNPFNGFGSSLTFNCLSSSENCAAVQAAYDEDPQVCGTVFPPLVFGNCSAMEIPQEETRTFDFKTSSRTFPNERWDNDYILGETQESSIGIVDYRCGIGLNTSTPMVLTYKKTVDRFNVCPDELPTLDFDESDQLNVRKDLRVFLNTGTELRKTGRSRRYSSGFPARRLYDEETISKIEDILSRSGNFDALNYHENYGPIWGSLFNGELLRFDGGSLGTGGFGDAESFQAYIYGTIDDTDALNEYNQLIEDEDLDLIPFMLAVIAYNSKPHSVSRSYGFRGSLSNRRRGDVYKEDGNCPPVIEDGSFSPLEELDGNCPRTFVLSRLGLNVNPNELDDEYGIYYKISEKGYPGEGFRFTIGKK